MKTNNFITLFFVLLTVSAVFARSTSRARRFNAIAAARGLDVTANEKTFNEYLDRVAKSNHEQVDVDLLNQLVSANKAGAIVSDASAKRLGIFADFFLDCTSKGLVWHAQTDVLKMKKLVNEYLNAKPKKAVLRAGRNEFNYSRDVYNNYSRQDNYVDNRSRITNVHDTVINNVIDQTNYDDQREYIKNIENIQKNTQINIDNTIDKRRYIENETNRFNNVNTNTNTNIIQGDHVTNRENNYNTNTNTNTQRIILRATPQRKAVTTAAAKVAVCKAARRRL
jgi:hypothetical protein